MEIARTAVAKVYSFHDLVTAGKGDEVKELAKSALREDVLDHPVIKEILVVIFFEESNSWGWTLGHLFEDKFSLQVFALAIALVRIYIYIIGFTLNWACYQYRAALHEWLTESVGKKTWAEAGDIDVYNWILNCILVFEEDAIKLLREWWFSAWVFYRFLELNLHGVLEFPLLLWNVLSKTSNLRTLCGGPHQPQWVLTFLPPQVPEPSARWTFCPVYSCFQAGSGL